MAVTQYIGARYVPVFADPVEWSDTKSYDPLTIVMHEGASYTSRQFVPVGIPLDNANFWVLTGNYNAQIEVYREEVARVADALPISSFEELTVADALNALKGTTMFAFDTVSAMQSSDMLYPGAICYTSGFHSINDGGAAHYVISDSLTPNGQDLIACGSLCAALVYEKSLNVMQFGAYGDDVHNDTAAIQRALDCGTNRDVYIPTGVFLVDNLYFGDQSEDHPSSRPNALRGNGSNGTTYSALHASPSCTTILTMRNALRCSVENMSFRGNNACVGINCTIDYIDSAPSTQNHFRNLDLHNCTTGLYGLRINDSELAFIDTTGITEYGLDLPCNGGYINLSNVTSFAAPIKIAGQMITLLNCMIGGVIVAYNDWNHLNIIGGYYYSNPHYNGVRGADFIFEKRVESVLLSGVHVETRDSVETFTGLITGEMTIIGSHIFSSDSSAFKLFNELDGLVGGLAHIRILGGKLGNCTADSTDKVIVSHEDDYYANNINFNMSGINAGGGLSNLMSVVGTQFADSIKTTDALNKKMGIKCKTFVGTSGTTLETLDNKNITTGTYLIMIGRAHPGANNKLVMGIYAVSKYAANMGDGDKTVTQLHTNGYANALTATFSWPSNGGLSIAANADAAGYSSVMYFYCGATPRT